MKSLLAALACGTLGLGGLGCGSAELSTTAPKPPTSPAAAVDTTGSSASSTAEQQAGGGNDDDVEPPEDYRDDDMIRFYGHAATSAETRAVTNLIKRYFVAALAADGVSGCSMLDQSLASSVPEDYGRAPGPLYLRGGKTCPEIMEKVFTHSHAQLASLAVKRTVDRVRLRGSSGFTVMRFGATMPERYISFTRVDGVWRI